MNDAVLAKAASIIECRTFDRVTGSIPNFPLFWSGIYYDLIARRQLHQAEHWNTSYDYERMLIESGTSSNSNTIALTNFLGKDLLLSYLNTLKDSHYLSKDYACSR